MVAISLPSGEKSIPVGTVSTWNVTIGHQKYYTDIPIYLNSHCCAEFIIIRLLYYYKKCKYIFLLWLVKSFFNEDNDLFTTVVFWAFTIPRMDLYLTLLVTNMNSYIQEYLWSEWYHYCLEDLITFMMSDTLYWNVPLVFIAKLGPKVAPCAVYLCKLIEIRVCLVLPL